jgi:hypothetical protein
MVAWFAQQFTVQGCHLIAANDHRRGMQQGDFGRFGPCQP